MKEPKKPPKPVQSSEFFQNILWFVAIACENFAMFPLRTIYVKRVLLTNGCNYSICRN